MSILDSLSFPEDENTPATAAEPTAPAADDDELCDHPECIAFRAAAKEVDQKIREREAQNAFLIALGVVPGDILFNDVEAEGKFAQIEYPGEGIDMAAEFARMQREAPELLANLGATTLDEVPTLRMQTGINGYLMNYGDAVDLFNALGKALGKL